MNSIHTNSLNKYFMESNYNINQSHKRPDRHGANNPMANRHHSEQTKNLMRQKALERNRQYQKWKDSQHHITMDEFLSNNPVAEQYIKNLIKEEIDKFICKQTKPAQKTLPLNIWL